MHKKLIPPQIINKFRVVKCTGNELYSTIKIHVNNF